MNKDRIYIAFRGTKDLNDWKYNLQAFRERCGSVIPGKFHSGFLQRAKSFPMETIFSDENFKNSDVIICGHSLGGAIASIVTLRLQLEKVLILKCFLGYVGANVLNLLLVVNRTTQTYQIIGST